MPRQPSERSQRSVRRTEPSGSGDVARGHLDLALTAAVCVTLAAASARWQWSQRQAAGEELGRLQGQLAASQNEESIAQAELDRSRAKVDKLEQAIVDANEAAIRSTESARAFAAWKQKLRGELTAANYQWSDDSPFVRIPKAALPELSELAKSAPISPPGVVNPHLRELLGLTPADRQAVEDILQSVADLQSGEKAEIYEMDKTLSGGKFASKVFATAPLGSVGTEAEARFSQMLTEIRGILGEERWPVMPNHVKTVNCEALNRMLIPEPATKIEAWAELDDKGAPKAGWFFCGEVAMPRNANTGSASTGSGKAGSGTVYSVNVVGYVNGRAALSEFLPDADPSQTLGPERLINNGVPEALRLRTAAWLQEQAIARLTSQLAVP